MIYGDHLPCAIRAVLSIGDRETADRLAAGIEPLSRASRLALASSHAQISEATRDLTAASSGYTEAADGWEAFGDVPEHAYARLGQGRCLVALGDAKAEAPLRRARGLFASMGYAPAVAAAEALLASGSAANLV